MKSRHPVPVRAVVMVAVSATPPHSLCGRTPPVARNPHKQAVLDAKLSSMIWGRFTLTSGLHRLSEKRLKPGKKNGIIRFSLSE